VVRGELLQEVLDEVADSIDSTILGVNPDGGFEFVAFCFRVKDPHVEVVMQFLGDFTGYIFFGSERMGFGVKRQSVLLGSDVRKFHDDAEVGIVVGHLIWVLV